MKYYLLLAEIEFDLPEYSVSDILLGHGLFKDKEDAKDEAERLLKKYCNDTYHAVYSGSFIKVKEITIENSFNNISNSTISF